MNPSHRFAQQRRAEAEKVVSGVARIGRRLSALISATGRVLLTALSDAELEDFLEIYTPTALTAKTVTDREGLIDRITKARDQRFAIVDEELEEGMISMALPVCDSKGAPVAALSVSALKARLSTDKMEGTFVPVLQRYSDAISRSI